MSGADLREALVPVINEMYVDGTLEPTATTTLSEVVDRIMAVVVPSELHPSEPHEFRATCRRCGEPGQVHIAIIGYDEVFAIKNRADLEPAS